MLARRLVPIALVAALLGPAAARAEGVVPCTAVPTINDRCPAWMQVDEATIDFPVDMVAGTDLVHVAATDGDFEGPALLLTAGDAVTGAPAWRTTIEGGSGLAAGPADLALAHGALYVTGGIDLEPGEWWDGDVRSTGDLVLASLDPATGDERWRVRRPAGFGHAVEASADGSRVFVAGRSGGGDEADLLVAAYDAGTGDELWAETYDGGLLDRAFALAVADDRVWVTGESRGDGDERDHDAVTLAYDAEDGDLVWSDRYDDGADAYSWEAGMSIALHDGSVYVSGRRGYQANTFLAAHDAATGEERWRRVLDPWGFFSDLVVDPSGRRLYLTGYESFAGDFGLDRTEAYDADTGGLLWANTFRTEGWTNYAPVAYDLEISPDGGSLYVGGVQRKQTSMLAWDFVTVAYDAVTGERRWLGSYQSGLPIFFSDIDLAYLVALRPDGGMVYTAGVFWSGQTFAGDPEGLAVLAYATD